MKAVYVHLVNRVACRDGAIAQIGWELAAIRSEVRKLGGEA